MSSPARMHSRDIVGGGVGRVLSPAPVAKQCSLCSLPLLLVSLALLVLQPCLAAPDGVLRLTDKTFDSIREAFTYPSMLLMFEGDDPSHVKALDQLVNDKILKDHGIVLASVKGKENRMLTARFEIDELPALLYLYSERAFRYQGELTPKLIRSYAMVGFQNQGGGVEIPAASWWLVAKFAYFERLYGSSADGASGSIDLGVVLASGFMVGILACASVAFFVCLFVKDDASGNEKKKIS